MPKSFEHVGLTCSNLENSVAFYRDLLELKEVARGRTASQPHSWTQQAVQWHGLISRRRGTTLSQTPFIEEGQRGWKAHPLGR